MALIVDQNTLVVSATRDPQIFTCTMEVCEYNSLKQDWQPTFRRITFLFNSNDTAASFKQKALAAYNAAIAAETSESTLESQIVTALSSSGNCRAFTRTDPNAPAPEPAIGSVSTKPMYVQVVS